MGSPIDLRYWFAFNMLDKKYFPMHDLLIGYDREGILVLCRALSPRVECFDGYLDDDFTALITRDDL